MTVLHLISCSGKRCIDVWKPLRVRGRVLICRNRNKDDPGRCQKLKCVIDIGARRLTQTTVLDLPGVKVMEAHGARGLSMCTECKG